MKLKTGEITISRMCKDIAEHVALAFTVVVLFVLCEPRPRDRVCSASPGLDGVDGVDGGDDPMPVISIRKRGLRRVG